MIEPGIAAWLAEIQRGAAHIPEPRSPQEQREYRELLAEALPPEVPPGMVIRNRFLNTPGRQIAIRMYYPARSANTNPTFQGTVVFFHGGGFISGSVFTHDVYAVALAETAGLPVVSVNYRLAPENPFPAAVEDCFFALRWISRQGDALGLNQRCLILAGDSAGGNLAAACSLKARDEGGPPIALQVLLYPCLDTNLDTDSYRANTNDPGLTRAAMEFIWKVYLIDGGEGDPLATPLIAKDLTDLPPAYILTGDLDPLRDDGLKYGERLKAAGVPTTVRNVEGGMHGMLRAFTHSEVVREELRLLAKTMQSCNVL